MRLLSRATRFRQFLVVSDALLPDRDQLNAQFVHALYPFLRDNADLLHALLKSVGDIDPEPLNGLDDYFARGAARMRAQYAPEGWGFDLAPELLVRYSFGMLAGVVLFRDWFFPGAAPDEAIAESMLARMRYNPSEPRADDVAP